MQRLNSMDDTINDDELGLTEEKPAQTARSDNRFKDLSEKVKTTAEERDKALEEKKKIEAEKEAARKDAEFYKNFNTVASKYDQATEYQDQIKVKVDAGYDLEDATISVLAKEGKFTPSVTRESPAGGSATTTLSSPDDKPIAEMTRDEKRAALEQIERESGGVSQILRRGL